MSHVLPPTDYIRAAKYLIERNGPKAQTRAESRAQALREEGNESCSTLWKLLAQTIATMSTQPGASP